jgi:hypothetical protein
MPSEPTLTSASPVTPDTMSSAVPLIDVVLLPAVIATTSTLRIPAPHAGRDREHPGHVLHGTRRAVGRGFESCRGRQFL